MSTGLKRGIAQATDDATALRALFDGCYEEWIIAGSVRRKKSDIGDVEHVVVPRFGEAAAGGLFGGQVETNLLWNRCEELLANGLVVKHLYGETRTTRWGDKYRGLEFRDFTHEIFTADGKNFGAILAIRTGPAEYSQMLVTELLRRGMKQDGGYVRYKRDGSVYPVKDERAFFEVCGVKFIDPERRR